MKHNSILYALLFSVFVTGWFLLSSIFNKEEQIACAGKHDSPGDKWEFFKRNTHTVEIGPDIVEIADKAGALNEHGRLQREDKQYNFSGYTIHICKHCGLRVREQDTWTLPTWYEMMENSKPAPPTNLRIEE